MHNWNLYQVLEDVLIKDFILFHFFVLVYYDSVLKCMSEFLFFLIIVISSSSSCIWSSNNSSIEVTVIYTLATLTLLQCTHANVYALIYF